MSTKKNHQPLSSIKQKNSEEDNRKRKKIIDFYKKTITFTSNKNEALKT